jgi:hypothetical protein
VLPVHLEHVGVVARPLEELLRRPEPIGEDRVNAVITDRRERDETGPPCPVDSLAEPGICLFRLA